LAFLDGDDTLIADLLHGLSNHLANRGVAVGENRADLGDLLIGRDLLGPALQVRHSGFHRQINPALQVHRVHAGGHRLGALADDRRRQHGCGGGAVAGEVVGLGATSRTIWAPMFSNLSWSSISLATVTPSFVMRGAPKDFSMTTLRPLGPASPSRHWQGCRRRAAGGRAHRMKT
jgi:hypothetical protein